jgi:glycosyltransferase involved in cell wall biosynthesis
MRVLNSSVGGSSQEWLASAALAEKEDAKDAGEESRPSSGAGRALETDLRAALLTGGMDRPYAFGMCLALSAAGIRLDVLGFTELDCAAVREAPGLRFLRTYGGQPRTSSKVSRVARQLAAYLRLLGYALTARPKIFHILWNGKFQVFDRTLLMIYFKLLGKRIVLTAHNVNIAERDGADSWLNRRSLRFQYRMADHIFVHTEKMKEDLLRTYGTGSSRATVIPFGINNSVPDTDLTPAEAKRRLGLDGTEKAVLFFGNIRQYKGIEYLVEAFQRLVSADPGYRLIIVGEAKKDSQLYWEEIRAGIRPEQIGRQVILEDRFVPDEETELYFKAADLLVLPYTHVFQSGVLFLGYSFGLPVVATDAGSLRDEVVEGETGFVCKSGDVDSLSQAIEGYFASPLFKDLSRHRAAIRAFAQRKNSWASVAGTTRNVYRSLLGTRHSAGH